MSSYKSLTASFSAKIKAFIDSLEGETTTQKLQAISNESGISYNSWQSLYYGRYHVNAAMVIFIARHYPNHFVNLIK
jgi:hypothetical protein